MLALLFILLLSILNVLVGECEEEVDKKNKIKANKQVEQVDEKF